MMAGWLDDGLVDDGWWLADALVDEGRMVDK